LEFSSLKIVKNQVYLEKNLKKIKRIKASRSNIHGGELVQTSGKEG